LDNCFTFEAGKLMGSVFDLKGFGHVQISCINPAIENFKLKIQQWLF